MYEINLSLETIVGNIAKLVHYKPGNQLLVSRNKVAPTPHPLIALVNGIDYTDQDVLDIFQHAYLEHVHINNVVHGFRNIKPNSQYKGDIIWCVGVVTEGAILTINEVVEALPENDRSDMHVCLISCGKLITWKELLVAFKSDSQLRVGFVGNPNVIYHTGVDMHRMLSMKTDMDKPTPAAFGNVSASERLWFIYRSSQPSTVVIDELRSYRVVYL